MCCLEVSQGQSARTAVNLGIYVARVGSCLAHQTLVLGDTVLLRQRAVSAIVVFAPVSSFRLRRARLALQSRVFVVVPGYCRIALCTHLDTFLVPPSQCRRAILTPIRLQRIKIRPLATATALELIIDVATVHTGYAVYAFLLFRVIIQWIYTVIAFLQRSNEPKRRGGAATIQIIAEVADGVAAVLALDAGHGVEVVDAVRVQAGVVALPSGSIVPEPNLVAFVVFDDAAGADDVVEVLFKVRDLYDPVAHHHVVDSQEVHVDGRREDVVGPHEQPREPNEGQLCPRYDLLSRAKESIVVAKCSWAASIPVG